MISRARITAASDELSPVDITSLMAMIRVSSRYKANPAYFSDLETLLLATVGTIKAQIINATLNALEALGPGVVEINQSQTVGTDGVIYSKALERDALIDYLLNSIYEEFSESTFIDPDAETTTVIRGEYGVGRLPLEYEGYL